MKLVQTLAFGVALLGSGAALAQPAAPPAAGPSPGARMFELMDANRDGRVSWDESWAFATSRFNTADADRSGGVTLQEFGTMRLTGRPDAAARTPRPGQAERTERMRGAMFRGFDANSDGVVTLVEIQPFAQARFRAMDANGDGAITRDELPRRGPRGGHHRGHRGERGAPAAPAAPAQ
ncbi:hypothetical protein EJV46_06470 [Roseococcus sp. SYP-B2431]|uniref:EF-hand domain-containing protein n=1 Tax=Roseococcus sp. SYP-B2431 TaxID=2496640 RepID=UPI00104030F1|nr:EF-hand domain-containing protein [Roseococcus sp. SYP-B2431]TCI00276.1 hypothetical protein EJV46_06470 [Roseococcus sp. SYP-B2431]